MPDLVIDNPIPATYTLLGERDMALIYPEEALRDRPRTTCHESLGDADCSSKGPRSRRRSFA